MALGVRVVGVAGSFAWWWGFGVMQNKLRLYLYSWALLRSMARERVPFRGC